MEKPVPIAAVAKVINAKPDFTGCWRPDLRFLGRKLTPTINHAARGRGDSLGRDPAE
jgi:hypothetical protein